MEIVHYSSFDVSNLLIFFNFVASISKTNLHVKLSTGKINEKKQ